MAVPSVAHGFGCVRVALISSGPSLGMVRNKHPCNKSDISPVDCNYHNVCCYVCLCSDSVAELFAHP